MNPKPVISDQEADLRDLQAAIEDIREEKVLFSWEAPERTFQKRDKDFWVTAIAILVLVAVILIFVKEFFLIFAFASLLFLYYVLSTVPPGRAKNKITNRGVYFGELFYGWNDLIRFWFKPATDYMMINFESQMPFPRKVVSLLFETKDQEKIKEIVLKYLPLVEASPRFVDKSADWLSKRLPLEERTKKQ